MKFKWNVFLIIACLNIIYGILATEKFMQLKWNHVFSYTFACWFYALYFIIFSYIQVRCFSNKRNIFLSIVLLIIIAYVLGIIIWSIGIYTFAPDKFIEKSKNYMDSSHFDLTFFIWNFLVGSFIYTLHAFWGAISTLSYVILNGMFNLIKKCYLIKRGNN